MSKTIVIPDCSPTYKTLAKAAKECRVVVFSGLPGVGKSLYINQFHAIASTYNRRIDLIQWDIARKAFETPHIAELYPMGDGVVHNGLKLTAGLWLEETVAKWAGSPESDLLLIEAPLVGHRFIELAKQSDASPIEAFLSSHQCQFIVPIPSIDVRKRIEEARKVDVSEDAKTWVGAKPSVMLQLWKMICGIANEYGADICMEGQPPYDPKIYDMVFSRILQHRNYVPLHVDEVFQIDISGEDELHALESMSASEEEANRFADLIDTTYPTNQSIDAVVDVWYKN